MRVAVIPARGGSKRIPRKNIKPFCGKPMIAWSIEAALESECFDEIIVSTDDQEISKIAKKYGAKTPFKRPHKLSDDYAGTIPVIQHVIRWCVKNGQEPEITCCIYATAPFVQASDIKKGLTVLEQEQCDYAFSVTSYPFPIQRAIRITSEKKVEMFNPENLNTRSQDLEKAYHDAGQFYWGYSNSWLEGIPVFSSTATPVFLPSYRVQDIDTPEDWRRAELLFRVLLEEGTEK